MSTLTTRHPATVITGEETPSTAACRPDGDATHQVGCVTVTVQLDPDTTVGLTPGELAAALHLSGARLSPTMLPTRARLTALVATGLSRAGLAAVRELAATTAELDERIDRGEATRADQARLRRLWRSVARDEACNLFGNGLAGFGPLVGWLR